MYPGRFVLGSWKGMSPRKQMLCGGQSYKNRDGNRILKAKAAGLCPAGPARAPVPRWTIQNRNKYDAFTKNWRLSLM